MFAMFALSSFVKAEECSIRIQGQDEKDKFGDPFTIVVESSNKHPDLRHRVYFSNLESDPELGDVHLLSKSGVRYLGRYSKKSVKVTSRSTVQMISSADLDKLPAKNYEATFEIEARCNINEHKIK